MKENKNSILENMKIELIQVRKKIESGGDKLPIDLGLPRVLKEIENEMTKDTPNKERLEKETHGIFRLVTESYVLEMSALGQELLILRGKIREFASALTPSE